MFPPRVSYSVPFFTRFRDFYYERVNGTIDFRPLAWVDFSPPLATHLGHRKSLGHYTTCRYRSQM
jgi:hypothetical protein